VGGGGGARHRRFHQVERASARAGPGRAPRPPAHRGPSASSCAASRASSAQRASSFLPPRPATRGRSGPARRRRDRGRADGSPTRGGGGERCGSARRRPLGIRRSLLQVAWPRARARRWGRRLGAQASELDLRLESRSACPAAPPRGSRARAGSRACLASACRRCSGVRGVPAATAARARRSGSSGRSRAARPPEERVAGWRPPPARRRVSAPAGRLGGALPMPRSRASARSPGQSRRAAAEAVAPRAAPRGPRSRAGSAGGRGRGRAPPDRWPTRRGRRCARRAIRGGASDRGPRDSGCAGGPSSSRRRRPEPARAGSRARRGARRGTAPRRSARRTRRTGARSGARASRAPRTRRSPATRCRGGDRSPRGGTAAGPARRSSRGITAELDEEGDQVPVLGVAGLVGQHREEARRGAPPAGRRSRDVPRPRRRPTTIALRTRVRPCSRRRRFFTRTDGGARRLDLAPGGARRERVALRTLRTRGGREPRHEDDHAEHDHEESSGNAPSQRKKGWSPGCGAPLGRRAPPGSRAGPPSAGARGRCAAGRDRPAARRAASSGRWPRSAGGRSTPRPP
jgi:hypothetical protein